MAKNKNDYFKLIEQQVGYCFIASNLLQDILCNYSTQTFRAQKEKICEIENRADDFHHNIVNKLAAEFITPIDQEDIMSLLQTIDDITDALSEVVLELYMFHIENIPTAIIDMSKIVNKCVKSLYEASKELKNFRKPASLRALLINVNSIENEADKLFADTIHELFGSDINTKSLIGYKTIYESLENCCNLCEHAANVIERIIIKNT